MKFFFLLLGMSPFLLMSQEQPSNRPIDSAKYYQTQIANLLKQAYDSTTKSDEYLKVKKSLENYAIKKHNYFGVTLFVDFVHSNYSKFNDSITKQGFPKLNSASYRFGIGISSKTDRTIIDFTFFAFGFSNKSQKADEKITSSLSNVLQFDLGYDFLHSKHISFYPFVGISARLSSLSYSKTALINSNYTSIANIVSNDPSVDASSFRIGYDAGLGLDFLITENKKKTTGKILFIKCATNRPIWADSYKIDDIKYKPEIKQADWMFSLGIKFIRR